MTQSDLGADYIFKPTIQLWFRFAMAALSLMLRPGKILGTFGVSVTLLGALLVHNLHLICPAGTAPYSPVGRADRPGAGAAPEVTAGAACRDVDPGEPGPDSR